MRENNQETERLRQAVEYLARDEPRRGKDVQRIARDALAEAEKLRARKKGSLTLTKDGVNLALGDKEEKLLGIIKEKLKNPQPGTKFWPAPGGHSLNDGGAGDRGI